MIQKSVNNSPSGSRRPSSNSINSNNINSPTGSPLRRVVLQQQQQLTPRSREGSITSTLSVKVPSEASSRQSLTRSREGSIASTLTVNSQISNRQQQSNRSREGSIISNTGSLKSVALSVKAPSEISSGYETITDVVCKGPLLYYKPRWFGETWRSYDGVLTTDGIFRWYKKGSDPAELEGSIVTKSVPKGLITIGASTEYVPREQQVQFPRGYSFNNAIAIGEPEESGEIFWFLCPSLDMIRLWEQGFRDTVVSEKFSSGTSTFSAWKKYSPDGPGEGSSHQEAWDSVKSNAALAIDCALIW